jgi:hypothetical protein
MFKEDYDSYKITLAFAVIVLVWHLYWMNDVYPYQENVLRKIVATVKQKKSVIGQSLES